MGRTDDLLVDGKCQRFPWHHPGDDQPVVITVDHSGLSRLEKRLDEDEGIHFLPKPFSLKQLAAKVKEVIEEDGGPSFPIELRPALPGPPRRGHGRSPPGPALESADEIWLTSSTREISPVTRLDDRSVGDGKPGPLWRRMIRLYQDYKRAVGAGEAV